MIFFLSGESSYHERVAIENARAFFLAKTKNAISGPIFDASESNLAAIEEYLLTNTLFGNPECIVIRGLVSAHGASALQWLQDSAPFLKDSRNIYIFIERSLPEDVEKKTRLFFEKNADKTKIVASLTGGALDSWLDKESQKRGVRLSSLERSQLIERCNGSEWALMQEIEKRSLGGEILVGGTRRVDEKAAFGMIDTIMRTKASAPMALVAEMRSVGVEADQLIYTFLWRLKTILLAHQGATKKLNPYVAKKAADDARNISLTQAAELFWKGVGVESQMRRGAAEAEGLFLSLLYHTKESLNISPKA